MAPAAAPCPPLALDVGLHIPLYFRCPISLDLMSDPVILCTGQTYDRSSIERWVANGNATCPVTMQKLDDFTLIPNHTLRRLIQDWCVANRVERIPTPKQPADLSLIQGLMADLQGEARGRVAALRRLRSLAKEGEKNRMVMVKAGVVPLLLAAVFEEVKEDGTDGGADKVEENGNEGDGVAVAEEALATVVALPLSESDKMMAATPKRLSYLSELLRTGGGDARANAAALIEMVSDSAEHPDLRVVLAKTEGMMGGLVALMRGVDGKEEAAERRRREAKAAIKAMFSLCLRRQGKEEAVAAGAAEALVERLAGSLTDRGEAERVLGTIELLCTMESGVGAIAAHSAVAVPRLVKFILKMSDRATEFAAASLLAICTVSETAKEEAVKAGVVMELLLLMQSDCRTRAKLKAMNLLKLLRNAYDNQAMMPDYGCRADVVPF